VDCFLIVKAKSEGAELFTFDQKAQKYTKNEITVCKDRSICAKTHADIVRR